MSDALAAQPFGPGSISIGVYVYEDADDSAVRRVDHLLELAALAERVGFDGVTASEHHRGRAGYMPNPLQLTGWYLDVLERAWAAPCPMVLPLRTAAVVAEEAAWLDARFPGRVGLAVAAGADPDDFAELDVPFATRAVDFEAGLDRLGALLSGTERSSLSEDPALSRCREHPIPVVAAAMTRTGVRRAARCGVGVAFGRVAWRRTGSDAGQEEDAPDGLRWLLETYQERGGVGPKVFTAQVFLGVAPEAVGAGLATRDVAGPAASGLVSGGSQQVSVGATAEQAAADLADALDAGMDCVNLRVPYPGVSFELAAEQIHRIAEELLPLVRRSFAERADAT